MPSKGSLTSLGALGKYTAHTTQTQSTGYPLPRLTHRALPAPPIRSITDSSTDTPLEPHRHRVAALPQTQHRRHPLAPDGVAEATAARRVCMWPRRP